MFSPTGPRLFVSPRWKAVIRLARYVSPRQACAFPCSTDPVPAAFTFPRRSDHGHVQHCRSGRIVRSSPACRQAARTPAVGGRTRPVARQIIPARPPVCRSGRGRRHARRRPPARRPVETGALGFVAQHDRRAMGLHHSNPACSDAGQRLHSRSGPHRSGCSGALGFASYAPRTGGVLKQSPRRI